VRPYIAFDPLQLETGFEESGLAAEETELAAGLLTAADDAELEAFLGDLIQRTGRALGQQVNNPLGRAIGRLLKGTAKSALESVWNAGSESVPVDSEFEMARRLVRTARTATQSALGSRRASPTNRARRAVALARRRHLPDLKGRRRRPRPGFRPPLARRRRLRPRPLAVREPHACPECGRADRSGGCACRHKRNVVVVNCWKPLEEPPPSEQT
jgi:hypothetical protein